MNPKQETRGRFSKVNPNIFDTLTDEAAYWIGFLMADGNVESDPGSTTRWKLGLVLAEQDYEHLAAFCRFLEVDPPTRNQSSLVKGKRYPIVRKSVRNDHLCETLISYGVVPDKTQTATAPPPLVGSIAFWRGVFDGDGCVCIDERTQAISIEMAGSEPLMKQFCIFAAPYYPNKKTYPNGKLYESTQIGKKKVHRVRIGGPLSHTLLAVLYDAPGPRLSRKEAKFRDWQATNWASKRGEYQVDSETP